MLAGLTVVVLSVGLAGGPIFIGDEKLRLRIFGTVYTAVGILQYASPCLETVSAILRRDSSFVNMPLAVSSWLCTALWTTYGLASGQPAFYIPNGFGNAMALFTLLVKLWVPSKADAGLLSSPHEELSKALNAGDRVTIRCMAFDKKLYLQAPSNSTSESPVTASTSIAAWTVECTGNGHVAFRAEDGRFLQLVQRPEGQNSSWCPVAFQLCAVQSGEPGEAGSFLPVEGFDKESLGSRGVPGMINDMQASFPQASVAFWNPLHKVFFRVNENGEVDSSPICRPVDGKVVIPPGWCWVRFLIERESMDPTDMVEGAVVAVRRRGLGGRHFSGAIGANPSVLGLPAGGDDTFSTAA